MPIKPISLEILESLHPSTLNCILTDKESTVREQLLSLELKRFFCASAPKNIFFAHDAQNSQNLFHLYTQQHIHNEPRTYDIEEDFIECWISLLDAEDEDADSVRKMLYLYDQYDTYLQDFLCKIIFTSRSCIMAFVTACIETNLQKTYINALCDRQELLHTKLMEDSHFVNFLSSINIEQKCRVHTEQINTFCTHDSQRLMSKFTLELIDKAQLEQQLLIEKHHGMPIKSSIVTPSYSPKLFRPTPTRSPDSITRSTPTSFMSLFMPRRVSSENNRLRSPIHFVSSLFNGLRTSSASVTPIVEYEQLSNALN